MIFLAVTTLEKMQLPFLIMLIGVVLLFFLAMNAFFSRLQLHPLIGYILLGYVVRTLGIYYGFLYHNITFSFELLGKIGVILLLFQIGLESHIKKLLKSIIKAGFISLFEIGFSGTLAFFTCYYLGLSFTASLIIAAALIATSLGVSSSLWGKENLSKRNEGSLLLDLASLDDIGGILLFSILFGVLGQEYSGSLDFLKELGFFLLKIVVFIGACYLFSHFAERKVVTELLRYEKMPDSMLSVLGLGLLIAGIAALIQFSLVIGAFFAGISFSRDKRSSLMDVSMKSLVDFFTPFFFFWIGYQISIASLQGIWLLLISLIVAAILGKIGGIWIPAIILRIRSAPAFLLAVSMVPRAEVTMVVMEQGLELDLVSRQLYTVIAIVVLFTSTPAT